MRIAIKFAYDGRLFHGFARQPQVKTVEGEIIKALIKHGIIEDTAASLFRSASRTDKGVSALGNVIAFNTDASKKQVLDDLSNEFSSILTYGIAAVDPEFNPRYAQHRHYRYFLRRNNLNCEQVISAAGSFTGEHDFSNFARVEPFRDPVKNLDNIVFTSEGDFFIIDFYAQMFLWHQIRRIISALEKIGTEKIAKEHVIAALYNPDKKVDFGLAPAESLILQDIVYDFDFEYDKKLLRKVNDLEKKLCSTILKLKP